MNMEGKQLSNPFATGGGGILFEAHVQASFVILMLTNGFLPCLIGKKIHKIKLQGRFLGYQTDDLIAFTSDTNSKTEHKLLAQIKHSISITESDSDFGEVIVAAWNDYNNPAVFTRNQDRFALVTGPLSATDNESRTILEWARSFENSQEFFTSVGLAKFSSDVKREKLKAFRTKLRIANNDVEVPDESTFDFLKHFNLLGYDLDIKTGVTLSLLHSLIGQYSIDNVHSIWTQVINEVQNANKTAGTLTRECLPIELKNNFIQKQEVIIPETYVAPDESTLIIPKQEHISSLVVATILGSWDEKKEGDKEIIEDLINGF